MIKNVKAITIVSVVFIAVVAVVLIKLGLWQLDRAQQKRQYLAQVSARLVLPHQPVELLFEQANTPADLSQLPVIATGYLQHQYTFLLDNVTHMGRVGYQVIVPLLIVPLVPGDVSRQLVLVNLGWVASTGFRDQLPPLQRWSGKLAVTGNLHQPKDNPYAFDTVSNGNWPQIIGQIKPNEMAKLLQLKIDNAKVFPAILRLDPSFELGYKKKWLWINMSVEKHLGYAMQWFALAITLVGLSGLFYRNFRRDLDVCDQKT
ncbi:MAG: SURF1 family protein [Gammaproteobacteria bacterium]|nr:SURF1 family protein [Gammaproteobacteria bacterium]